MQEQYNENDLIKKKGTIFTRDMKYAILSDGTDYNYWHKVKRIENRVITLGHSLGKEAYDYIWPSHPKLAVKRLNEIIKKYSIK